MAQASRFDEVFDEVYKTNPPYPPGTPEESDIPGYVPTPEKMPYGTGGTLHRRPLRAGEEADMEVHGPQQISTPTGDDSLTSDAVSGEEPPSAQAGLDDRKAAALAARFRRTKKTEAALPQPKSEEEYEQLAEGTEFLDPEGGRRVKPYKPQSKEEYANLPEGVEFLDPEGNVRTTPTYQGVDFTAQTLYNMAVNDKERFKALERSYPGKVKTNEAGQLVVDDDGVMRKPKGFREAPGASLTAMAAPVVGSVVGEIAGGVAGGAGTFGIGTLPGALAGAGAGAAVGQTVNDVVLALAGVYDRSIGEQAFETGFATGTSVVGSAVGRAIAGAAPTAKDIVRRGGPGRIANMLGAEREGLETAIGLAEQGVLVPPSGWAKESPHIINITQVFDPAFRTQKPMLQSATGFYEKEAGGILESMGVARPPDAGPISKPTAEVSTLKAGEALKQRALTEMTEADTRLRAVLDARRAALTETAVTPEAHTARLQELQQAETNARQAAQQLIDVGFQEIQQGIDTAMRTARAGGNSGELWWSVGEQLRAVKTGISERANIMYRQADELAGDIRPDLRGLPDLADDFLRQLPEGFEGRYPGIVQQIRALAGQEAVHDASGAVVREAVPPVEPTFGQLHNLRSILRQNYNSLDLTPDIKQGTFKFFAHRVDDILRAPGEDPALQAAAVALREADTFYREAMGPLTDKNIQAVMNGLESGMPADPKMLFDTLIKEGRSELTRQVRELVGPTLWAGVRAADVQEMLDLSRTLVPGVIDGKRFAAQVLDRERHGMLEAVHGREITQQLRQQALAIEALAGRQDVRVVAGDTVREIISRAHAAAAAAKAEAKADPLKTLNKEMKNIAAEHSREVAAVKRAREQEPLGFLIKPTTGAAEAVDKILASEDLVLATAARFGETSPEFNMLRQIYAQRVLKGTLEPGKKLAQMSPELQQLMFPGTTLDQMKTLAKNMDFLMGARGVQETAKSMSAQAKIEHPWAHILGRGGAISRTLTAPIRIIPGADFAGRQILSKYYALWTTLFSSPAFLRWVQKGLNGDEAAREMTRQQVQRMMQRGGAIGAGIGESQFQAPDMEPSTRMHSEPIPAREQPTVERRSSLQDEGRVASDAMEDLVRPGQQYAMMEHKKGKLFNPLDSFSPILPDPNAIAGGASGAAPVGPKPAVPKTKSSNLQSGSIQAAYDAIKSEQGISTVFIGDIIQRSGLPKEVVHAALREAARKGDVALNAGSTINMSKIQQEGRMPNPDRTPQGERLTRTAEPDWFATVTFRKGAQLDERTLKTSSPTSESPREIIARGVRAGQTDEEIAKILGTMSASDVRVVRTSNSFKEYLAGSK